MFCKQPIARHICPTARSIKKMQWLPTVGKANRVRRWPFPVRPTLLPREKETDRESVGREKPSRSQVRPDRTRNREAVGYWRYTPLTITTSYTGTRRYTGWLRARARAPKFKSLPGAVDLTIDDRPPSIRSDRLRSHNITEREGGGRGVAESFIIIGGVSNSCIRHCDRAAFTSLIDLSQGASVITNTSEFIDGKLKFSKNRLTWFMMIHNDQ